MDHALISQELHSKSLDTFYNWKNRVKDQPLDLFSVQLWSGWTGFGTKCQICKRDPVYNLYEVNLQWGDTDNFEYIRDMCPSCLHNLNEKYIRNKSPKY